jgi:hypothetical protein
MGRADGEIRRPVQHVRRDSKPVDNRRVVPHGRDSLGKCPKRLSLIHTVDMTRGNKNSSEAGVKKDNNQQLL